MKLPVCVLTLAACACCAAAERLPLTYANPIDLLYRVRPEEKMCFREGADPEIVLHADKYWLFASKCGGYYVSDDLANWRNWTCAAWTRSWTTTGRLRPTTRPGSPGDLSNK